MEKNKIIFSEFIRIYKHNRCLWDSKHPNYKSQVAKKDAYEQLLAVMKKFDPTNPENTIETVKRKINSMRASFRRDYRKVKKSGNTFVPNLWYYDQLLFVKNHYSKEILSPIKQEEDTKTEDESTEEEFTILNVTNGSPNIQEEEIYETHEIEEHLDEEEYFDQNETQISEVCVQAPPDTVTVLEEHLLGKNEECSTFGKQIGLELQLMNERQRIIAKKLLSDIAYYGRLDRLTEHTEISCTKRPEN